MEPIFKKFCLNRHHKILLYCFLILQITSFAQAQDFLYSGQFSHWLSFNKQEKESGQLGLRYIPDLTYSQPISGSHLFDADASVKIFGLAQYLSGAKPNYNDDFSAYRLWARLSGSQYEVRIGLQKINFGSASIFRPLMWFDTIDPRDPLQITSGVYGLLGRYYFLNNANIWLWGLLGNEDPKGWEFVPTVKEKPQFGGRLQVPLFSGEAGISYHYRQLELKNLAPFMPPGTNTSEPENRFAFDGKWNIELGFWVEAAVTHHKSDLLLYDWEQSYTIGLDYTFDVGNGWHLLSEYFVLENTDELLKPGDKIAFSAFSVDYPIGLLDKCSGIVYYDWENEDFYRLINFQRTYDHWSFYLFAFWNPDENKLKLSAQESSQFSGKGLQLMIVFNH